MAEPAAPFIKLSDADNAINLLLSSSISNPISQKFEPTKNFGSGNLYKPFLSRISHHPQPTAVGRPNPLVQPD